MERANNESEGQVTTVSFDAVDADLIRRRAAAAGMTPEEYIQAVVRDRLDALAAEMDEAQ